jgi:hypothetical protein
LTVSELCQSNRELSPAARDEIIARIETINEAAERDASPPQLSFEHQRLRAIPILPQPL